MAWSRSRPWATSRSKTSRPTRTTDNPETSAWCHATKPTGTTRRIRSFLCDKFPGVQRPKHVGLYRAARRSCSATSVRPSLRFARAGHPHGRRTSAVPSPRVPRPRGATRRQTARSQLRSRRRRRDAVLGNRAFSARSSYEERPGKGPPRYSAAGRWGSRQRDCCRAVASR